MRTSSAILTGLSLLLSPIAGAADTSIGEGEASEDITDYRLEDLLNVDASGGGKGSFGYRLDQLDQLGVTPYLHAYSVFDAEFEQDAPTSFDQHYFNVFVGADIQDLIVAETQLEYEHGGDEIQMRFGQVDIRTPSELITFRLGKFLVPMGRYNTHTYPEFLSKLPDRPMVLREIVPVSWAEVGAQIHGSYSWDESRSVGYSLYVVNGLEQADADPSDGVIDDGGAIRSMRQNNEEVNNANKAIGGRLGAEPIPGVKAGVSGYTGAYTVDGKQRLSIANVDLGVHKRRATLEAEITIAMQQTRRRDLTKLGYYVLIGYRVLDWFEPVAQYDAIDLDGAATDDRRRMTGGLVIYPFPKKIGTAVLKSSFASTTDARGDSSWRAVGQVAVGF